MKARHLNLALVPLFLFAAYFMASPPSEGQEVSRMGSDRSVSQDTTSDWWASQALLSGLHRGSSNPSPSPNANTSRLKSKEHQKVNSKCWELELLGRSGAKDAVAVVSSYTTSKSWEIRAAAYLALGRLGAYEQAMAGLEDSETVTLFEMERRVGEGGSASYYRPVVLATLKGLTSQEHSVETLPFLLAGLRARPMEEVSYDSTPEPFPDTVTRSNPGWYQEEVADQVRRLGWSALPAIQAELKQPDRSLSETTGGRFRAMGQNSGPTVHSFLQKLAPGLQ